MGRPYSRRQSNNLRSSASPVRYCLLDPYQLPLQQLPCISYHARIVKTEHDFGMNEKCYLMIDKGAHSRGGGASQGGFVWKMLKMCHTAWHTRLIL